MQTDKASEDPEANEIIIGLRKGGKAPPAAGGYAKGDEEEGSASDEALLTASEDLFQAIRGRAPNEQEAEAVRTALQSAINACGR